VRTGLALLVLAAALGPGAGCFYTGDLNDRPSAEIQRLGTGVPLRGETVRFQALIVDPGDEVEVGWRIDACRTAPGGEVCDEAIATSVPAVLQIEAVVPLAAGAGVERGPTERLRVHLDVVDSHGAVARPGQQVVLEVGNQAPTVRVQPRGRELAGAYPEEAPIFIAARGEDPEGDAVTVACEPFPPAGSVPGAWSWVQVGDPPSGGHEWRLVPDVPGVWIVRCTARDPLTATMVDTPITVVADRPPCLGATEPAPAAGATIVLDAPRRFAVLVVDDDLDVYPAPAPDDPFLAAAGFRWSIRLVGDVGFYEVDADIAAIELDPANHAPGDRLDVRVELDDRRGRAIDCPADAATCSLSLDACLQRQTWRVEVR
jgi:hypothetical protein